MPQGIDSTKKKIADESYVGCDGLRREKLLVAASRLALASPTTIVGCSDLAIRRYAARKLSVERTPPTPTEVLRSDSRLTCNPHVQCSTQGQRMHGDGKSC